MKILSQILSTGIDKIHIVTCYASICWWCWYIMNNCCMLTNSADCLETQSSIVFLWAENLPIMFVFIFYNQQNSLSHFYLRKSFNFSAADISVTFSTSTFSSSHWKNRHNAMPSLTWASRKPFASTSFLTTFIITIGLLANIRLSTGTTVWIASLARDKSILPVVVRT